MNFVFLMDPLHTVVMEKDTTFRLMLGSLRRGHNVYFLPEGGMSYKDGHVFFHVVDVTPQEDSQQPFIENQSQVLLEKEIDAIFVRNDPPFDEQYLLNTWLLDLLSEKIFIINRPRGIRNANEKIWALQFPSLVPKTFVGRNRKDLVEFLREEQEIIAKPTDRFGGQAVFHIRKADKNAIVILETLTHNWQKEIILQEYLPEAETGDKRILLLNGEPLGAVLRVHGEEDHRNNFFAGGKPIKAEINAGDREIIRELKPKLLENGLYFVGIDVIGDRLVEVNVTSPTCLQEINTIKGKKLEDDVVAFVEKSVEEKRSFGKIPA